MKVLMINGSPKSNGNTALALGEMEKIFKAEGIETEVLHVGNQAIRGCIGCGKCAAQCPMNNIQMVEKTAKASNQCTMCYRCINICPQQAITLLGKSVIQQGTIEKYL